MLVLRDDLNDIPLLRVVGEVDHATAPMLTEAVHEALSSRPGCILVDLGSCPYMDSGGVSVFLDTLRRVRHDGWLGVIAPPADVVRILTLVGLTLDPAFRAYADIGEAEGFTATLLQTGGTAPGL